MSSDQVAVSSSSSSDAASRTEFGAARRMPSVAEIRQFERAMDRSSDTRNEPRTEGDPLREESDRVRLRASIEGATMSSTWSEAAVISTGSAQASPPAMLDDLIAQYVRQLAISDPSAADPRMMLKLDPTLFPDTELFLIKGAEGWILQANTRAPAVFHLLAEYGPALERRFALRRLGTLRIESKLQEPAALPVG